MTQNRIESVTDQSTVPPILLSWLAVFRPCFTAPVWNHILVLVGGAPLNEEFATAIGADAYCRDAAVAVETAKALIAHRHNQLTPAT